MLLAARPNAIAAANPAVAGTGTGTGIGTGTGTGTGIGTSIGTPASSAEHRHHRTEVGCAEDLHA